MGLGNEPGLIKVGLTIRLGTGLGLAWTQHMLVPKSINVLSINFLVDGKVSEQYLFIVKKLLWIKPAMQRPTAVLSGTHLFSR